MTKDEERPSQNNRAWRRETDHKFLWLVLFTLVVVGGGVIALVYGPTAMLTSLPVLLGAAALIVVPYLVLKGIELLLKRYNGES